MQQIAILIIAILSYVRGIRYDGGNVGIDINDSVNFIQQQQQQTQNTFVPSDAYGETEVTAALNGHAISATAARQSQTSNAFRPSQIIDFTLNDATDTSGYFKTAPSTANEHFTFPNEYEQRQQPPANSYAYNKYDYNNNNNNNNNGNYVKTNVVHVATMPAQLPSTPILTYKDPYTNENHYQQNGPTVAVQSPYYGDEQEYTVGSSLYVGGNNDVGSNRHPTTSNYYAQQNRPGLVFEEQLNSHQQYRPQSSSSNSSPFGARPPLPVTNKVAQRLSYDSHDYPPPSYAEIPTLPPKELAVGPIYTGSVSPAQLTSSGSLSSTGSNYANNFDHYLPDKYWSTGNLQHQPGPQRPTANYEHYNNHETKYQLGEIPATHYRPQYAYQPATYYVPQQRPPPLVTPAGPPGIGFASLASLLGSTPQFTNLLLSGIGGGQQHTRPLQNMQLIKALENIARNDDLQCVPKVLCQMIAAQTQRGQLPTFITSPTITK